MSILEEYSCANSFKKFMDSDYIAVELDEINDDSMAVDEDIF